MFTQQSIFVIVYELIMKVSIKYSILLLNVYIILHLSYNGIMATPLQNIK